MLVNNRTIGLAVYILLLIGILLGGIYWGNKNIKSDKQIEMKYKKVNFNSKISGKITDWRFRGFRSYSSSWEIDSIQLITFPWAENWAYPKKHLSHFLQVNDSVVKPQNSDTLYIFRNNEQFYFVLEKRIGK